MVKKCLAGRSACGRSGSAAKRGISSGSRSDSQATRVPSGRQNSHLVPGDKAWRAGGAPVRRHWPWATPGEAVPGAAVAGWHLSQWQYPAHRGRHRRPSAPHRRERFPSSPSCRPKTPPWIPTRSGSSRSRDITSTRLWLGPLASAIRRPRLTTGTIRVQVVRPSLGHLCLRPACGAAVWKTSVLLPVTVQRIRLAEGIKAPASCRRWTHDRGLLSTAALAAKLSIPVNWLHVQIRKKRLLIDPQSTGAYLFPDTQVVLDGVRNLRNHIINELDQRICQVTVGGINMGDRSPSFTQQKSCSGAARQGDAGG